MIFTVPGEPTGYENEIWKPIKGYEDEYEVSNFGRVRSLDRIQRRSNGFVECDFRIRGKVLKPYLTGSRDGYYTVTIRDKNMKIHRLVAEAFLPRAIDQSEVNHIDGNKHNNKATNLEWITGLENTRHAFRTGLIRTGENVRNAKLTASDVAQIRKTYSKGDAVFGAKPLARKYGVSYTTIQRIVNQQKWRYV